jgi:hypothetical protein
LGDAISYIFLGHERGGSALVLSYHQSTISAGTYMLASLCMGRLS